MNLRPNWLACVATLVLACTHPNPAFDVENEGGAGGTGAGGDTEPFVIQGPITPPATGLVARFSFDETGGTQAKDSSGNGLTATASGTGATFVPGLFGQALQLTGAANLSVPDCDCLDRITTGVSIAAWVKQASISPGFRSIASRHVQGTNEEQYYLGVLEGSAVGIVAQHSAVYGPTELPTQQWVHLAMTYDGATLTVYVNGASIGQLSAAYALRADSTPLIIGGNQNFDNVSEKWDGLIDELLLYSRALSASEVRGLASR